MSPSAFFLRFWKEESRPRRARQTDQHLGLFQRANRYPLGSRWPNDDALERTALHRSERRGLDCARRIGSRWRIDSSRALVDSSAARSKGNIETPPSSTTSPTIRKSRPWQQVDRMFYDAMRCSGVGVVEAKTFYFALYRHGRHWKFKKKSEEARSHRDESGRGRCDPAMDQAKQSQPGSNRIASGREWALRNPMLSSRAAQTPRLQLNSQDHSESRSSALALRLASICDVCRWDSELGIRRMSSQRLPGPHRARPGFAPVCSPSFSTCTPFTNTCFIPTAY